MSDVMTATMTVGELAENFEFLGDWEERYRYIIDLGRELEPLPEEYKVEDYRVQGCVSKVWLVGRADPTDPERITFIADSDAHIVKGLIAIALLLYSGKTAGEILDVDAREVLKRLDLGEHLSPSRSNGFYAMIRKIREIAERRLHGLPLESCAIIQ
ncbi:MAG: SufE family protein [Kiloniellales bacterium]|nr:SufE family protein [Kiloniellales bacterium]